MTSPSSPRSNGGGKISSLSLSSDEIRMWLKEVDPARLEELWHRADTVRHLSVGDAVYLRGLIEFSNYCCRQCSYCGLRRDHRLQRYRMTEEEILASAHKAVTLGYGTVVLQSGEDRGMDPRWLAHVIRRIKEETPLAVTLSVGERDEEELALWREAGADRYFLRFETSDLALLWKIHPPRNHSQSSPSSPPKRDDLKEVEAIHPRITILKKIREFGYEVGSGVMVGIPGQTWDSLVQDLLMFQKLDLDMIGLGPYLPHPETPLGKEASQPQEVPADTLTTCKMIALTRLLCPNANIPSTTALATLDPKEGRDLGLQRGANIVMPNLTPPQYRRLYEIYPGKGNPEETAEAYHRTLCTHIEALGRTIGRGRGDSPNRWARR